MKIKQLIPVFTFMFSSLGLFAEKTEAHFPEKNWAFLDQYCMNCHDADTEKGKVNLEDLPFKITTIEQAEQWQKVMESLNSGEMPPEDKKQPNNDEKADFLDDLALTMVKTRRVLSDSGGLITMSRLNRREYQNTIQELLGVKVNVENLPQDGGGGSYDTAGSSQFISSSQFEQYLELGRKALDEFFEKRNAEGIHKPMVFRIDPEDTVNPDLRLEVKGMEERQETFQRWKAVVDRVAAEPQNKEIVDSLIKDKGYQPDDQRFYASADLLKGLPDVESYGYKDAKRAAFSNTLYNRYYTYFKHYVDLPHNDRGTYLKTTWGTGRIDIIPPKGMMPPGTYKLRIKAGIAEGAPAFRHFIELGHPQRRNNLKKGLAGFPISTHHVTGAIESPNLIETNLVVGHDTPREFSIQERQPVEGTALRNAFNEDKRINGYGHIPSIWVDWIELEGPLPEKEEESVLKELMLKHNLRSAISRDVLQTEYENVRRFLKDFAYRAMRETEASERFIDQLVQIYKEERTRGQQLRSLWIPLEEAIRTPLSIILASPGFIYLNEPSEDKTRRSLTQRELAVRLAYFLWSSPPDRTLLYLAKSNQLKRPEILRAQVERMIADPKSDKFVSGFTHQWLDMKRLDLFQFSPKLHREFDESTRAAAREEVYQSFSHLLRGGEGGDIGLLLQSDYVMINGLLGTYYGLEGVQGDHFRKVKLPKNSPRGGFLGMAAIHAMGSDGVETSPVERGAWVLRHILNSPPPPAPANVPQISRLADKVLTTRERLIAHQEKAQCASCHRKIDPIGFGLENFNAAGKWRTVEHHTIKGKKHTWEIDPSGQFYKGPAFADYFELRKNIASKREDFARGFTESLIAYALGRSFAFTDEALAEQIMTKAKNSNYALNEFFYALVETKEFQSK